MRVCVVAFVGLISTAAYAGGDIGVVTGGDATLQPQVGKHVEGWLKKQGNSIVASPLSRDATTTLRNCFLLEDIKCARGVFDARAKSFSLVYVAAERDDKDIAFTVYWFAKGHEPIGEKQTCEKCTTEAWHGFLDATLQRLSSVAKVALGKLELSSEPTGMTVMLDDVKIGTTPISRDIPAGKHTIELRYAGQPVGQRDVAIAGGETSSVAMKVDIEDIDTGPPPSKTVPRILLYGGLATVIAGGVLVYVGTWDKAEHKYSYPGFAPAGIALCAVGGGAVLTGGILLLRSRSSRHAPVAAVAPGGAYLGWAGEF